MFSYFQPRIAIAALEVLVYVFIGTTSVAVRLESDSSNFQATYRQQSVSEARLVELITFVIVTMF
jgi:hypothetical protein